jgi:hypothetical protein
VIYLTPGTYNYTSGQFLSRYGTSAAPIKIRVRPDANVATQRQVIFNMTNAKNYQNGISVYGAYLDIDGAVTGAPTSKKYFVIKNSAGNGINLKGYEGGAANNITIKNLEISHSQYSAIFIAKRDGNAEGASRWRPWLVRISSCDIHDNVLHNSSRAAGIVWAGTIASLEADDVQVTNCNIYKNYGEGVFFCSTSAGYIANCYVGNNYSTNIYFDNATYGTATNNSVGGNNSAYYRNGYAANGITIANEVWQYYSYAPYYPSRNISVTNNNVYDCGYGIWFWRGSTNWDDVLTNTTITGNTFARNGANLIIDAWGTGNTVQ